MILAENALPLELHEPEPSWSAREAVILTAATVLAGVLRFASFARLGLNHYDEGGYALSALAVARGGAPEAILPTQHLLAPPLFFWMGGLVSRLTGFEVDVALLGTSAAFGTLTVPLVYLVARTWFGRSAAAASSLLVAFSGYHVLYSRMALTDVTFAFFLLLGLWLHARAQQRVSLGWSLAAGLAVGLAWNTKYHGPLAGVAAGVMLIPSLLAADGRLRVRLLRNFAVSVAVSCLVYLPWFLHIQSQDGGYAELMANHRRFLRQAGDFLQHAAIHARAQLYYDGWVTRLSVPVALLGAAAAAGRWRTALLVVPLATVATLIVGGAGAAVVFALLGVWLAAGAGLRGPRLGLLALFAIFSVLTPLYHPYGRLLLPWLTAAWLLAGVSMQALVGDRRRLGSAGSSALLIGAAVAAAVVWGRGVSEPLRTWEASDGMEKSAASLADRLPRGARVFVIGEPALCYYLRRDGVAAENADTLRFLRGVRSGDVVHVISGRYARSLHHVARYAERHPSAVTRLTSVPTRVNEVRRLDDFVTPERARAYRAVPGADHDFDLFEIRKP